MDDLESKYRRLFFLVLAVLWTILCITWGVCLHYLFLTVQDRIYIAEYHGLGADPKLRNDFPVSKGK